MLAIGRKESDIGSMAPIHTSRFTRKGPDIVSEEVAMALFGKPAFEFKALFTIVHAGLRARKSSGGGEEMLRLRVYEKLQALVSRGMVDKVVTKGVKEYLGLASLSSALPLVPVVAAVV